MSAYEEGIDNPAWQDETGDVCTPLPQPKIISNRRPLSGELKRRDSDVPATWKSPVHTNDGVYPPYHPDLKYALPEGNALRATISSPPVMTGHNSLPKKKISGDFSFQFDKDGNLTKRPSDFLTPSEPAPSSKITDFDDVLPYLGEFGLYQKFLFLLTAPFSIFLSFVYFSQLFITLTPDHWCKVPGLENLTESFSPQFDKRSISIPILEGDLNTGVTGGYSSCEMYDVDYEQVIKENLKPNASWKVVPCQEWEYDYTNTRYPTIVSEYNWVCENAGNAPLAQALFFCGSILGGITIGYMADRFGRIPALITCNLMGALAGIITAYSYNLGIFLFARFLMGIAFDNSFTMIYIIVLEYVGPQYRTLVANLSIALFYTAGTVALPWIAWIVSDWRLFSLYTSVPLISSVLAVWIVPESARWLLSQGHSDKAIDIIRRFAKINKKEVDEKVYTALKVATEEAQKATANEKTRTVIDLLKTPRLRRNVILLTLVWVMIAVVYDGHARNTANMGLSVFISFSIASATELPADLIVVFFLDKWGRRALAFGSLFLAGIFSVASIGVPGDLGWLAATLAIIGRFCVNITFNIGLQYGAELIPTEVRAQGITAIHIAGYVASIVSPYIVDLARLSPILPLLILGALAITGAILVVMLPETLGAILPQTMEDGENFGKDQGFWDFPCCSKKNLASDEEQTMPPMKGGDFTPEPRIMLRNSLRTSLRGETLRSSLLAKKTKTRTPVRRVFTTRN